MLFDRIIARYKTSRPDSSPEMDLMRVQGALGVVAILPFSVWRFIQGEYTLGLIDLLIVIGMVILVALSGNRAYFRLVSLLFTLVYTVGMLTVTILKGADMLFWSYPTAVAGFFMVRLREALIISVLSLLALSYIVLDELGWLQLFSFQVSYVLVCLFSSIFSVRMARDRRRLSQEATIDPLTGAYNRRSLDDDIEKAVSNYQNRKNAVSLVLFDVDHFKQINDQFGHATGDIFLQRFVDFLKGMIREEESLYRFGGEEFVVLTNGGLEDALSLAEQARGLLEQTKLISGHYVTVSVGVAELGEIESAREWMKRADDALYRAKHSGRNRVCQAELPVDWAMIKLEELTADND